MNWSTRPFLRIIIFLVAGILIAYWMPVTGKINSNYLLISLAILAITGFVAYKLNLGWNRRWMIGAILGFSIFLSGILLVKLKENKPDALPINKHETYIGRILEDPVKTVNNIRTVIEISHIVDNDTVKIMPGRTLAYLKQDSVSTHLEYGDIIVFSARLNLPEGPKNPGEFDYANFLTMNDIQYTVFISGDKWNLLGASPNTLMSTAINARKYLLQVLQDNGIKGDDFAVAAAILLGYDQLLETELEQNYVTAGAMHILCVSGLHVGIIYLVLNFLLGFLRRNKFQKIIKMVLLLGLIWFYALLTGFSPSVQRASLMISLFIIAGISSKQKDVYNTLAASAVILLYADPFIIFNVGFQLSYTAVLGILIFYKPIASIFYIKNPVVRKIWEIVAVSVAAQLGTFPLAAHYFHFFPTYFWLTNIFIFPLSFAIVGAGMTLMIISWIPFVSNFIGIILSGFVYLLNLIVDSVKFLPYYGIYDLYFPWLKVILVYLLILLMIQLIFKKKIKMMFPALVVLLLVILYQTEHKYRILNQEKLAVYSINQHSAIDFICQDKHVLLVDSVILTDNQKLDYHLSNCRIGWGLDKNYEPIEESDINNEINLFYDGQFGAFRDYTFMRIFDKIPYRSKPISVDLLIVSGKTELDLEDLTRVIKFDYLIVDASVPFWKQKNIAEQAERLHLKYFNVSEQGAFVKNL